MYGREQVSRVWVTGESMEEDDMVIRVGNSLVLRRTDKEDKRAVSLRELIRRCQGLAEGQPWRPAKRSLIYLVVYIGLTRSLKRTSFYS